MELGNTIISAEGASLRINNSDILKDIFLNVSEGEVCGLVGMNGSGKSMLIKMISGIVPLSTGSVRVFGVRIGCNGNVAPATGILVEQPGLLLEYNAGVNLDILLSLQVKEKKNMRRAKIVKLLMEVGLDPDDQRPVKKYSLGMKQKLGIAQAFLNDPHLILLDEPSNNLDTTSINIIHDLIKKTNQKRRTTFLIASHQKNDIDELCSRIIQVKNGRIFG